MTGFAKQSSVWHGKCGAMDCFVGLVIFLDFAPICDSLIAFG
jgi:hypothetical protein